MFRENEGGAAAVNLISQIRRMGDGRTAPPPIDVNRLYSAVGIPQDIAAKLREVHETRVPPCIEYRVDSIHLTCNRFSQSDRGREGFYF